ncbi:MAG: metallophosphoesterase [Chloroflexi bacterium]|nr:metallophosphoesterase [Chloroflexota bacterium]
MHAITVFGDIHANFPALRAALDEMNARGHENRFCLGDLVGYGTSPNEVVGLIRDSGCPTIMGNYDQGVGLDSDDCGCAYTNPVSEALGKRSIAWTNTHTSAENKAYLRGLLPSVRVEVGSLRVLLVHGSPRRINEYLFVDRPSAMLDRLLDEADTDVIICGHTHLPYHRVLPSGRHVINAGSVGKPKDEDPRACYVVVSAVGREILVEFVRVAYDIEAAAAAIEASEMPHEYAQMLRLGKG